MKRRPWPPVFTGHVNPAPPGPPPPAPPPPPVPVTYTDRATVVFLPDGKLLVGIPAGWSSAAREHEVAERLNAWLNEREGDLAAVLPFAFDVIDKREVRDQEAPQD